jgi:hypothetical protein
MPTKIIREPAHIEALAKILGERKLPLTVSWSQGAPRSEDQNALSHRWYADIARQLGDQTPSQVRAECKVEYAAPILCEESEPFRMSWTKLRERFSHEEILEFVERTELPMTRLMLVGQMSRYMDRLWQVYRVGQGLHLTDPEALKYEREFGPVVPA